MANIDRSTFERYATLAGNAGAEFAGGNTLPGNAQSGSSGGMEGIIRNAAKRYGVDPDVLVSLARRESGLNPVAKNPSTSAGGLFQFIDGTWGQYGRGDKFDPEANADAGARYLRDNLKRFGGDYDLALAAHHVGPGKARQALSDESIGDANISTQKWLAEIKGSAPNGLDANELQRVAQNRYDTLYRQNPVADWDEFAVSKAAAKRREDIANEGLWDAAKHGFGDATAQIPQLAAGAGAALGDLLGWDALRDAGLSYVRKSNAEAADNARPYASFSDAMESGDGARWVAYALGYGVNQITQSFVTGGLGSVLGKAGLTGLLKGTAARATKDALAKGLVKEKAAEAGVAAAELAARKYGAALGMYSHSFVQEVGSIYPDAVEQAEKTGDPMSLARVIGAAGVASVLEVVPEVGIAGKLIDGAGKGAKHMLGRAAGTVPKQIGLESGTEYAQTGVEQWGAKKPLDTPEAAKERLDSAAMGGVMGGPMGVIEAVPAPRPNSPLTRAAEAAAAHAPQNPGGPAAQEPPSEFDQRLGRVQSFVEDKDFLRALRGTEGMGPESVTELLSAFARARNPHVDQALRIRAMDDIERFIETFNNRPNFVLGGGADEGGSPQVGAANMPTSPGSSGVVTTGGPVEPEDDGLTLDGEATDLGSQNYPNDPSRRLNAPPVLGLPTEEALQAKRNADAEFDQAYQDLVKADQLGAEDVLLQQLQDAMRVARERQAEADIRLKEIEDAIAFNRQKQTAEKRRTVLDDILSDPETKNPGARFAAELLRQGFASPVATPEEMRAIQRFQDVSEARPAEVLPPEIEPSTPNEMDPYVPPKAPALTVPRVKPMTAAEIRQAVENGATLNRDGVLSTKDGKRLSLRGPQIAAAKKAIADMTGKAASTNSEESSQGLVDGDTAFANNKIFTADRVAAARAQIAPESTPSLAELNSGNSFVDGIKSTGLLDVRTDIDAAAHESAASPLNDTPRPTDKQIEAENYKVGRVRLHGMDISIENPRGSVRSGTSPDGKRWENLLHAHYGRILGSTGADGDHIDVFLTDGAEAAKTAWVIDQKNDDGAFDEHKVVIGPATEQEARAAYLANYSAGWDGIGAITSMPMEAFKAWALDGKKKRKPLVYAAPKSESQQDGHIRESAIDKALRSVGIDPKAPVDKAKKLRRDAEKLQNEARAMLDRVPPGQPVGSARDANLREKSAEKSRKAAEMFNEADRLDAEKAGAGETAARDAVTQADAVAPEQFDVELVPTTQAQAAQAKTQETKIGDMGRKVIVRKDTATALGPRSKTANTDERPAWIRKYHVMQDKNGTWEIMEDVGSGRRKGMVKRVSYNRYATEQEAWDALPLVVAAKRHRAYSYTDKAGKQQYGIFRNITDRKRAMVKGGFATTNEAMEYIAANPVEIIEHKFPFPERPWLDKIERTGKDYRKGKNVTKQMFDDTFAPGAVVYGNWLLNGDGTANDDGQELSNFIYDSLRDLAEAIGVPPKALFLNGELALGIGADGKGGKNSAAAHYDPNPGKVLINLTKIKGAGSAAHEWWHAVDHYFARHGGYLDSASVVAGDFPHDSKARPELVEAIKRVVDTMLFSTKSHTTDADVVRAGAQRRVDAAIQSLDYYARDLRSTLKEGRYNKGKKVATEAQLRQWDAMVERLKAGDMGERVYINNPSKMRGAMGFETGSVLRDMNALYKSVVGRSFLRQDPESTGRRLHWVVRSIKENLERTTAEQDETSTYKGRTDYYLEAKQIDNYRTGDYWSMPEELGARAFESYIFDKLTGTGNRSDYLVYAVENRHYAALGMKPYPEGAERTAINAAFDNLFSTIQTKETDKGVALFSNAPTTANPSTAATLRTELAKSPLGRLVGALERRGLLKVHEGVETLPESAGQYMTAWHGSPHDFDKFSLDKIGTGEGAQAYGHGLYFAGKREIADYYRKTLSEGRVLLNGEPADGSTDRGAAARLIADGLAGGKTFDEARRDIAKQYAKYRDASAKEADDLAKRVGEPPAPGWGTLTITDEDVQQQRDRAKYYADKLAALNALKEGEVTVGKGRLYQVELAPSEDEYLDWDKTLSEQSEKVRAALEQSGVETRWQILNADGDGIGSAVAASAKSAIAAWQEVAGSRAKTAVSAKPVDFQTGEVLYREIEQARGSHKSASTYLHSIGIRGIKYLDGTSRGKGDGNFNYVLFNDADVTVTGKFSRNRNATAAGFFDGKTLHLVAPNIEQGQAYSVLMHEGFHKLLHALDFKGSPAYTKLMQRLKNIEALAKRGEAGEWFNRAREAIPEADRADESTRLNELAAYAVQAYESGERTLPERIAKWAEDMVAAVRAYLAEKLGWLPKNLTAADLSAMTRRYLREVARGEDVGVVGNGAEAQAYSMADGETSAGRLAAAVEQWKAVVRDYLSHALDRTRTYTLLPETPASMQALGLPNLEVRTGPHALDYANVRLTLAQLEDLPRQLAQPQLVYIHDGSDGLSINFATEYGNASGVVVVALKPNQHIGEANNAHFVATVLNVKADRIVGEVRNGHAMYVGGRGLYPGLDDALVSAKRQKGRRASELRELLSRNYGLASVTRRVVFPSDLVKMIGDGRSRYSQAGAGAVPSVLRAEGNPDPGSMDGIFSREAADGFLREFLGSYPDAPDVVMVDRFDLLPAEVQRDAKDQGSNEYSTKGAFNHRDGRVYLVVGNHNSMADFQATVFHEVEGHAGVRAMYGVEFVQELNKLFIGLGGVEGLARIMKARGMDRQFRDYIQGVAAARGKNPKIWTEAISKAVLTEEVFAHLSEQKGLKPLRDRFMVLLGKIRDWLRKHAFMELADLGESDLLFLLQHARERLGGGSVGGGSTVLRNGVEVGPREIVDSNGRVVAKEGSPDFAAVKLLAGRLGLREQAGVTVFAAARRVWQGVRSVNDFLVPETPEYEGNMTGDLAYVPEGVGLPALPIRINVGIVRGNHEGRGLMHMADNATRDRTRMPRRETGDLSEDLVRDAISVMRGAVVGFHERDGIYVLANPAQRRALVLSRRGDHYAIQTLRPYDGADPTRLWGDPVWRGGRLTFPSQTTAATEPSQSDRQGVDSPHPDRTGQEVRTERFDLTRPEGGRQVTVTVKKRRQIAKEDVPDGDVQRQRRPGINNANTRTALFTALARFDEAFQQPRPTGKTVPEIAQEIDPGYRVKERPRYWAQNATQGKAVKAWEIVVPKSEFRSGYLYEDALGRVWIDVSRVQSGVDAGNKIYGMAAGYAHNTGKVFIGDPAGLSPVAFFRRLENMISSALRYGTTDHLYPHGAQVDPEAYYADQYPDFAKSVSGLGLEWKEGDFTHNLTEMLQKSYNAAIRFAPEIKEIVYDFDNRQFADANTGERRSRRNFEDISGGLRGKPQTRYRGGGSTLARAALFNSLLRGERKERWRSIVAALGDQLRGRGLDFELREILYQKGGPAESGLTAEQFRSALVERFGEAGVASLEKQGLLNIAEPIDGDTPAWYLDGQAYFVPSLIRDDKHAVEAVFHEIGEHHGLESMLGAQGWKSLKARVVLAAKADGSIAAAWRGVLANYPEFAGLEKADYSEAAENDRFIHEVVAKIGESAAGRKSSLFAWIAEKIRAFMRSLGVDVAATEDEIARLVDGSLARVMGWNGHDGPTGRVRMDQRAWHGSPHDHDKFDMSKVGTGEGAQAYGYGHYFASRKQVAEHYRDQLSKVTPAHNTIDGKRITKKLLEELQQSDDVGVRDFFNSKGGMRAAGITNIAPAIDSAIELAQEVRDDYQQRLDKYEANPPLASTYGPVDYRAWIAAQNRRIAGLQKIQGHIGFVPAKKNGKLYQVELAPTEDEYLLWDKPLSEQSAKVKAALEKVRSGLEGGGVLDDYLDRLNADWGDVTGKELYQKLLDRAHSDDVLGLFDLDAERSDKAASEYLHSIGVRGIKYLDGSSRGNGDGDYNYVIFNDGDVEVVEKFQRPFDLGDFARSPSARPSIRTKIADLIGGLTGDSAKTFNWWQRTVGSQYGKAKSDPQHFGRVYARAHAFLDDVSRIANEAADFAPNILPHLDGWRDIAAGLNVKRQWADAKDYQAIAPAIFEGTLANGTTGKVWTDSELRGRFDLNKKQVGLYREFRSAVDNALEALAISEMARAARAAKLDVAYQSLSMDQSALFYAGQIDPLVAEARKAQFDSAGGLVARHEAERQAIEDMASDSGYDPKVLASIKKVMDERHAVEVAEATRALNDLESLRASFFDKAERIRQLQEEGYAPLMRFGQYTVDVVRRDASGEVLKNEEGEPDRPFFGMFETEQEAIRAAKILAEEHPGYDVSRGILSVDSSQIFRGITPETAEMFGRLLGVDRDGAFQAYLKQAVANRSAMKRLIQRQGMEGFATDVPRVLAAFLTSTARMAAGNWHFGDLTKAVEDIPQSKGDVKDEAIRLMQYVQNPQEEAAGLRGFLFFNFLGGSVASAVVNLTQTLTTTLPYLAQFGGAKVAKVLPASIKLAGKIMANGFDAIKDVDLRAALHRASEEGIVDPQEIHLLMAESSGSGASGGISRLAGAINKEWATPAARAGRAFTQAWGSMFGAAEKYNRHVAFIAAWEMAPKGVDRYAFAKDAVTETQFDYSKASRPNWARGAVGATLFTFRTFTINYVEFLGRLPSRERALALAVLMLLAGLSGAPGADDLDDLIDTIGQKMGYNWNNTAGRHAWLVKTLGAGGANFVEHGISSMLPFDVSSRLGLGNIAPGTGILLKSSSNKSRDVEEFFGPAGSLMSGASDVFGNLGSGKSVVETVHPVLPKAVKDAYQAIDMLQTGQYRDSRGRRVVDVDAIDAVFKALGVHPNTVAEPRRIERMLAQSAAMQRAIKQDINELWARGQYERDAEKVAAAKEILRRWNEKNPETPIRANPVSIAHRVQAMRASSADRLVKATPKEMRGALSRELEVVE